MKLLSNNTLRIVSGIFMITAVLLTFANFANMILIYIIGGTGLFLFGIYLLKTDKSKYKSKLAPYLLGITAIIIYLVIMTL
ncbi:hypothetical protein LX73_1175 [Fodinibius salinus]|uniref:Uncharacterized protein n=1 Tax=Fodinibius salinus TaxID=860790 RepID=A0A5D3YL99_9BACT|nr:hypothetical protein LX73_1175 [Fodinibius salinus]